MKTITLERFAYTPMGTFGKLTMPEFSCYTVEKPWRDNKPFVSCIPEGEYDLKLGMYNRGGYPAYEVMNVPNRILIKIHVANTMDDVLGCIGPGLALGYVENKWAVTSSKAALKTFMEAMDGDEVGKLIIQPVAEVFYE